jgi:RNase P/RNase MRP subunit p29
MSLSSLIGFSSMGIAGTVTNKTANQVLIDFQGESVPSVKSQYHVLDQSTHKEIGLVEVVQVQGTRVMSRILQGTAKPGDRTDVYWKAPSIAKQTQQGRNPAETIPAKKALKKKTSKKGKSKFGVGVNIVYTSFYIKNELGSGSISGISGGFRVAYDIPATKWLAFTTLVGFHPQSAKAALAEVNLEKNASYLALEGLGRIIVDKSNRGFWIGGGVGYYMPIAYKGATKPNSEVDLLGSMGFNIPFGKNYLSLKGDLILLENNSYQMVGGGVYYF